MLIVRMTEVDVFESDFESTDEEEYAKQGIEDGEKQVQMEEKAERRAARAKASKIGSAPAQKILERAMRGQPAPKKKQPSTKNILEHRFGSLWDATRQSERASTVKHKFQVQERLKDAEKRKAHAPKRPRPIAPTKTQDELIAAALELEEKNTKALREFLQKEEEKRAAARKVVRLKIEGPVVRWVSRGEVPLVEEVKEEPGTRQTSVTASQAQVQTPPAQASVSQTSTTPAPAVVGPAPSPIGPDPSSTSISTSTVAPARSSTPSRTQRMQVYVEIPTPSKSIRRSLSARSQSPLASRGLNVPSTQPLARSPLSSTVSLPRSPLSAPEPLVPESGPSQSSGEPQRSESLQPPGPTSSYSSEPTSQHQGPRSIPSQSNVLRTSHLPTAIRQSSVSSSGSGKSKGKMIMYVEIPMRKRDKGKALVPGSAESPRPNGLLLEPSSVPAVVSDSVAVPKSTPATSTTVFSSPSVPTLSTPSAPAHAPLSQKQTRNYVIVEYGGGARASFGWNMQAVFGKHADWEDVLINGVKVPHPVKPTCPITGLSAPYRDSRTGIPYANAYAYKTLTRLLAHEFVWSKERGCYIGDEGRDPARSVPLGWRSAATGRF
ncbi:vacuolar protein sorting-associated protein 72 [Rhizoctonia solani]|uniref:Vacuolar protein sorting-associated protein 72 n=1 Tax=Rhizoctonia solani TaxID=456999 RepID=A0A0K6GGL1_9AGAM|nr:vacuolar protein sorting-associated protein 72 [Rhizoctonia solani]